MVDISDFIDDGEGDDEGEAADLVALKACLKALADAIASTNLAVVASSQHDPSQAAARVQASLAALKRFTEAFAVLDPPPEDGTVADEEED
jgi:hypothetical protein